MYVYIHNERASLCVCMCVHGWLCMVCVCFVTVCILVCVFVCIERCHQETVCVCMNRAMSSGDCMCLYE